MARQHAKPCVHIDFDMQDFDKGRAAGQGMVNRCADFLRATSLADFIRPISFCGTPLCLEKTPPNGTQSYIANRAKLRSLALALGRFTACRRVSSGERQRPFDDTSLLPSYGARGEAK